MQKDLLLTITISLKYPESNSSKDQLLKNKLCKKYTILLVLI